MAIVVNTTFSDAGVSSQYGVKAGDKLKYTVDLSNDFDGRLFLRKTKDGGQTYELTAITTDVTDVVVDSDGGVYDFKCEYGVGEVALTGTAAVTIYSFDIVIHEFKDKSGRAVMSVTEGGLEFGAGFNESSVGVGAKNGDTVVVQELGNTVVKQTVLSLTATPVTVANTTGASFGGVKLYDFPAGRILVLGVTADLSMDWSASDIVATGSGDFSMGTTITADATLDGTDVNLLPSTGMLDPFVAGVGTAKGALAASAQFDGTSTAIDANLNIIIDDADVADAASDIVLVTGTVKLTWINLGDY